MSLRIGCLDAAYTERAAHAACILARGWDAAESEAVVTASDDLVAAYVPGAFSARELSALRAVLGKLDRLPDVLIVDGYVWLDADETRPGLGGQLYLALDRAAAVVGVAKSRFAGDQWSRAVLRGRSTRPLFVTAVGMELDAAATAVAGMHGPYRMPTLLKLADTTVRAMRTGAATSD